VRSPRRRCGPAAAALRLLAALGLAGIATGCGGPEFRHEVAAPKMPGAMIDGRGVYYDREAPFEIGFEIVAPLHTFLVAVRNGSDRTLEVDASRARFVGPDRRRSEVAAWAARPIGLPAIEAPPGTLEALVRPAPVFRVPPHSTVEVYVHSREGFERSGERVALKPQLPDEDLAGREAGLDLPVEAPGEAGFRSRYVELRFELRSPGAED